MPLPDNDEAYLRDRNLAHSIADEANMLCVVINSYRLPDGYDHTEADLLLRLSSGYPDIRPDSWWISPGIKLADGREVRATEVIETHLGRDWQRWSRHLDDQQWQPGTDGLENYIALIEQELTRRLAEPSA
jgi:hypothetical protein